jgi:hypothetical protein
MSKLPTLKSAKRFTGDTLRQYSPRGLLLYVLSLALIPAVVIGLGKGNVMTVIVNASAFTLYCLAAIWLRKGLQAENPSPQDRLQSPSKWPLKLFSAVLVAFTTGLLAVLAAQQSLVMAAIYACGAFLGMYFSYGFDQAKSRQIAGAHGYSKVDPIVQTNYYLV